ncbi:MAG: sulfite exporter TauE/SafE family protein [Methylococcales bacterium]
MPFDQLINSYHLAAFVMGVFSSVHCIGMCGSIIGTLTLSLPEEIRNKKSRLFPFVFNYNFGRIFSYTTGGIIAGLIGQIFVFPMGDKVGYRVLQLISSMFIVSAGFYIAGWFPRFAYIEKVGVKLWYKIEPFGRKLMPVKTLRQAFFFGVIWGWMPCGLVYSAIALSMTTGDIVQSSLTMLFFGLGTLPAVMGVGIMTGVLTTLTRMRKYRIMVGTLLILMGVLAAFPEINPLRISAFKLIKLF